VRLSPRSPPSARERAREPFSFLKGLATCFAARSPHSVPTRKTKISMIIRRMSTEHLDWQSAHDHLSRIAKERAHLDCEEGGSLLCALRANVHLHLGFASFAEYIERLFGYSPRWTEERLRVAEALEVLPHLQHALRDGSVPWSTARELTRVATPESEHAWLEASRGRTLRQVEQLVAGHKPGDQPADAPDPSLRRHVLRMEVAAETFATFREAMAKLRRESDEPLDEDTALLLMARQVLGGPTDEGRASYQVAVTVCSECNRGWQQGRGEQVEVGAGIIGMARCDAQHVGSVAPHSTHVGEDGGSATRSRRAHQDIPPAVRREVLRRDGGRCVVPGCRHAVFLDLHHIIPRSEGGDHDPDTLVTLCSAHHRAQHRGQLVIEGRVSTGLIFRHADGSSYGSIANPVASDIYAQVFRALCNLGFRERQARDSLERVRVRTHVGEPDFQGVIRDALAVLTGQGTTSRRRAPGRGEGRV
jgi:HNH endonuclease